MSAFLLGTGFRADMGTCARKLVLLKLIDACEEDGSRIFPAISTIARAAQCSTRQVQRELKAFLDVGLIRLVREGGKGPRSTNEYAMDIGVLERLGKMGWAAVVNRPSEAKGDTVSPLNEAEKGDTGDTKRVTPETDKGDKLSHPTPPYPSLDPSIEREREREDENPKTNERAFEKAYRAWPTSIGDSRPEALKAWMGLTAAERELAAVEADRYVAACKASGRKLVCAYSKYLGEKRWEGLPPLEPEQKPDVLEARPFGPLWQVARTKKLILGPQVVTMALTLFQQQQVDAGKVDVDALRREKLSKSGWPAINAMHERAANRQGVMVAAALEAFVPMMEAVPVGSDVFEAWRAEHERRGWPWIPDPGEQRVVYFPAGGPGSLDAFEQAIRGRQEARQAEGQTGNEGSHDAGGREAAE